MDSAEMFRAREVYRYYQPKSLADPSNSPSTSPDQQHNPNSFNALQSFSDTALTAIAQLIAIRLASQRAIVSLIDHENEYFLAESTSTLSHLDDSPTQNAWLSISGARVPLHASLSEQTLRLVPNQETPVERTPVLFVPDLRLDENMSQLDCVKGSPYLRFYCGVPLTNKKGVNIGCVYVVDDKPRSDFSLEQAQFLTTMAATIMDHLENIRAKEDVARVTKMSQALHAFIEGDGTMDGDWERLKRYNLPSGAGVGFHWESNKVDGKRVGTSRSHSRTTSLPSSEATSPGLSPLQHTTSNQDARYNFNNSPWSSTSEVPLVPQLNSVLAGTGNEAARLTGGRDAEFSTDGFSNLLHGTFSRASNLVREGMEVDGAVFFDAPFKFYQGRSALQPDTRRSDTQNTESTDSTQSPNESSDEDHPISRPGPSPQVHRRSYRRSKTGSNYPGEEGLESDILGYSTQDSSSWNDQETKPHPAFQSIQQSLLTSLVRRYPKGQIFVFDENGPSLAPSPESPSRDSEVTVTLTTAITKEKQARRQARTIAELKRLLAAFPGSRQIFFVPLYDSTSGCFIGSFAWSTSATRIFSIENHLSYLVAFGHSVMSEVSRLNTLSADHAKGDFISNVSHELRSPLHGILASVEFLADTTLDGFQRNLVETVDICGRTLLDTIEHVLDFSKIKKFGQDSMQSMGVVADLDVSAVIEEVLEGVFAGFEFNGLSSLGLADMTKSHAQGPKDGNGKVLPSMEPQQNNLADSLNIILDMDYRDQWKFPTVPGTWRRLTMNIFGNALKYTRSGYIKIRLQARGIAPSIDPGSNAHAKDRTIVTMTISDSGQGMSSEFMKTKLFMPFSQEDVTAPGTGLGMSIVKQITDLAGGTIDVRSEIGKGTEITLSLPLESCSSLPSDISENLQDSASAFEDPVKAVRRRSRGRAVTIRGFESLPGSSALQIQSLSSLKVSIEKYVTDWFDLEISSDNTDADILICDESAFLHSSATQLKFRTMLILCSNSARRDIYTAQLDTTQSIEFVSKPCGPHRLAKALLKCFDSEDAMRIPNEHRVSLTGSRHNTTISHGPRLDVTVKTADAGKSFRLIGNLQSQIIGFSPTTNLPRSESEGDNSTQSLLKRKPNGTRKGLNTHKPSKKVDVSESTTTSNEASGLSATSATPNSSTSDLEGDDDLGPVAPKTTPLRIPKMLLVEDNPINMMLLETYMKKNNWELEKAANGLLAVQAFQNRPEGFDVIFMDVSMPVMNGYESTRLIRSIEAERRIAYEHQQRIQSPWLAPPEPSFPFHIQPSSKSSSPSSYPSIDLHLSTPQLQLNKSALIIALTGFSSEKDQELAFESGVDVFMTKPVRFREVGRILDGWNKSREREILGLQPLAEKGGGVNPGAAE